MKKSTVAILGVLVLSTGMWTATTPASALGACGPNRYRNAYGYCVWGGQREAWCLRHTGHVAGHGPLGTRWCG